MSLTEKNNGQTIQMTFGQKQKITLNGNPTTGYSWMVIESTGVTADIDYVQDPCEPGMCGVPGTYTITLTATQRGEGQIVLAYKRAWETKAPASKFSLKLSIL
ncbi:Amoebiasin-1, putative [Entamoeba invadens IP1]|uniref:Amoebiasin-1, putative n=2 Tax=Entamoeba invadens TaxID=33085 RepID=A0A0A1TY47_ENTIV|nr:Amoebiasin-1, putative [Entamoeba invadens IP1]ELP86442.1 Amoebiasin-1, putative [Entamoeba invadens IP1]CAZ65726.1 amoebiasin-1 [Entamoeba invadens]|eukprot:XP_004185788.1 Amoebiasin-1, putative [Entamoeba invadens IP1]